MDIDDSEIITQPEWVTEMANHLTQLQNPYHHLYSTPCHGSYTGPKRPSFTQ